MKETLKHHPCLCLPPGTAGCGATSAVQALMHGGEGMMLIQVFGSRMRQERASTGCKST